MNSAISKQLVYQLQKHHIGVHDEQLTQLQDYIDLLIKWNTTYNLVGNDKPEEIIHRHIIDSLLVMPYITTQRIIDVGTGAGLPGIPLAIMLPDKQWTLIDSNGKKTRFVTQAKIRLQLNNVTVINQRVESYQPEHLFDAVISRAFASLADMIQVTEHLCTPEGQFIALKGDAVQSEIEALPERITCKLAQRLPYANEAINRQIVILQRH